jgi:hypothetical protein
MIASIQQELAMICTGNISLEQMCAILLSVFYSTKMTQTAFHIVIEFAQLISNLKIPRTFDGVAKGQFLFYLKNFDY